MSQTPIRRLDAREPEFLSTLDALLLNCIRRLASLREPLPVMYRAMYCASMLALLCRLPAMGTDTLGAAAGGTGWLRAAL